MNKFLAAILLLIISTGSASAMRRKKMQPQRNDEIVSVTFHRTACFGRCPTYTIELRNDGTVQYTGIMFTKDIGVYKKNIGIVKVKTLFHHFNELRVDTCKEMYVPTITDVPGIEYVINYKSRTKKIHNANFGPDYLRELGKEIDAMITVDNTWKKIADKAPGL
ncbi:MAG: hypothetical protein H0X33_09960 [Taibaiella sp.]|nr:hypothetical protein [Taibaiella sp.]